MMMIDRTPVSVISNSDKSQRDFDAYWEKFSSEDTTKKLKIACYPEGSTVDWFIHQSFNRFGAFDVMRVPFGKAGEFEAISNGACDYAVTLEPWLLTENQQVLHDMPIAPFGFTGILSHKRHFDHPNKRELLYEIVRTTSSEIANLYRTFEPSLFDWEMFKDWAKLPQNVSAEKDKEQHNYALLISKHLDKPVTVDGLRWMTSHRIWAMDPLLPLSGGADRHFKSAAELTIELLAEKEKESQVQLAGVHTIHHLKNELMNKVSLPLRKYIDELKKKSGRAHEEFRLDDLEKIKKHVDELSDKFKKWLNALNLKLNQEEKNFSFSTYEMESYLRKLRQIHHLKEEDINFELRGIEPTQEGYILDRAIAPSVLMELMLDEIVGNAVGAYGVIKKKAETGLDTAFSSKFGIKVIWERIQSAQETFVQIQVENTGTYLPYDKIKVLGKIPTKSGTDGSGFGLHFLNIALQIFDCGMVDTTFARYFLPENLTNANGSEFVRFTFHFPAKV
jgi:hypothetical protein